MIGSQTSHLIRRLFHIVLSTVIILLISGCDTKESNESNNIITLSIDSTRIKYSDDSATVVIDTFWAGGSYSTEIIYQDLNIAHSYRNIKNKQLEYNLSYNDSSVFSILRKAGEEEKVTGNNVVILEKELDMDSIKLWLFVARPIISDSCLISLYHIHQYSQSHDFRNFKLKDKNKLFFKAKLKDGDCYLESKVYLNSGNNYVFVQKVKNAATLPNNVSP